MLSTKNQPVFFPLKTPGAIEKGSPSQAGPGPLWAEGLKGLRFTQIQRGFCWSLLVHGGVAIVKQSLVEKCLICGVCFDIPRWSWLGDVAICSPGLFVVCVDLYLNICTARAHWISASFFGVFRCWSKQLFLMHVHSTNVFGSVTCVLRYSLEVGNFPGKLFTTWQVSPLTSEPKKRRRF